MIDRVATPWGMPRRALALAATLVLGMAAGCPGDDAPNRAPTMELSVTELERTYSVGDTITISALARDDDGDPLSFSYTYMSSNSATSIGEAELFPAASMATFRWSPKPSDVTVGDPIRLIFVVEDGRGGRAEREIKLNIVAGNGQPRFESGANALYTRCCDAPLELEVKVRDDDTEQVTLAMRNAPEGATFTQLDGKKGAFKWTPTAEQAARRVHSVTFTADDSVTGLVEQKVTIIIPPDSLNTGGQPGVERPDVCAGEQVITHTPLGPQRDPASEFAVTATLDVQGAARYEEAVLFWSDVDPTSDNGAVYSVPMTRDGATITGAIPNVTTFSGASRTLFYKICLIDADAAAGDTGAVLCAPTSAELYHGFTVYLDAQEACLEDGRDTLGATDDDMFGGASVVTPGEWLGRRACAGDVDMHSVRVRPGQEVSLLVAYPIGAALDLKLFDGQEQDVSTRIERSDCTGLASASLSVPAGGQAQTFTLQTSGDEIPYHVSAVEVSSGGGCMDKANEPNSDASTATPLTSGKRESLEICPDGNDLDVYAVTLTQGQRLSVVMNHASAQANLDMTLYSPAQRDEVERNGGVAFTFSFGDDAETLTYDAQQCGTYYLSVFTNDAPATYTLDVAIEDSACQDDDQFTCNHQQSSASIFSWNDQSYSLKLCGGGEDWFKHRGNNAEILGAVRPTDGSPPSALTFEIYDEAGQRIAQGAPDGGEVVLTHTFADDAFYYFRVASDEDVSYELTVLQ